MGIRIWIWRWVHVAVEKPTIVTYLVAFDFPSPTKAFHRLPWLHRNPKGKYSILWGYTKSFYSTFCFPFYSTTQRAIVSRNSVIEVFYALSFHGQLALWFRVGQHVWPMRLFALWVDCSHSPGKTIHWIRVHNKINTNNLIFVSVYCKLATGIVCKYTYGQSNFSMGKKV